VPSFCLQKWLAHAGEDITFSGSKSIKYPILLDAHGEPRQQILKAFLLWLAEQPMLQHNAIKWAQKYLQKSMVLERMARKLPELPKGSANRWTVVKIAAKETQRTRGKEKIASCQDLSTRADHLPTFDEMISMMHCCLAGDARIHPEPLRALQTGAEVRMTHTTGVRGQLVRSAKFEHLWPRDYAALAHGKGVTATVMYNVRGDKTHIEGDGSHTGWLPSRNPLLCPSGTLGLCLLLRFMGGESFPDVCSDDGRQYKWLPLIRTTGSSTLDTTKALLPIRGVCAKTQNACFNSLYAAAGVEMFKGDAVTHAGRAAAQQEFEDAGGDSRISNEALGYQASRSRPNRHCPSRSRPNHRCHVRLSHNRH